MSPSVSSKALLVSKIACFVSLTVAAAAFTLLAFQISALAVSTAAFVQHADSEAGSVAAKLEAAVDAVNRPCGAGVACGTLAEAGKTMVDAGDLIKQSQLTEIREQQLLDDSLPPMLAHANRSLDNVDQATAGVAPLLASTAARIDALAPLETNAADLVTHLDTESSATFNHADTLLTNPQVPLILANIQGMTATANRSLFTFNAVEEKATHNYLHPSPNPFVRTWQTAKPFLLPGVQIGGAIAIEVAK